MCIWVTLVTKQFATLLQVYNPTFRTEIHQDLNAVFTQIELPLSETVAVIYTNPKTSKRSGNDCNSGCFHSVVAGASLYLAQSICLQFELIESGQVHASISDRAGDEPV